MSASETPHDSITTIAEVSASESLVNDLLVTNVAKRLSALVGAAVVPLEVLCTAYVRATLDACNGNKSHAARALGIDRRSIYRWLAKQAA